MELTVDISKKSEIQKTIIRLKKSTAILRYISIALLLIGLIVGAVLLTVRLTSSTICMQRVNGVLKKDFGWAIISSSFFIVPCLVLSLCIKKLVDNLGGVNCNSRIFEALIIKPDALVYSFRIKYQSFAKERIAITIPFNRIKNATYNHKSNKLQFFGMIQRELFEDYENPNPQSSSIIGEFVIYDYFEPSLYDKLSNYITLEEE